jgi:hypothetical protein
MSYLLPHLRSGWAVDQAILSEEERVVCLRFGRDGDETGMPRDEARARARHLARLVQFQILPSSSRRAVR